jgi:hypothetical protein
MISTRSAGAEGLESISVQRESPIGGRCERSAASGVSRPGTFVMSIEPGLKPSARF